MLHLIESDKYFYLRVPVFSNRPISDRSAFIDFFKKDKVFSEAIRISSESLFTNLCEFDYLSEGEKERALMSLYKYYLRMCYRCTPFGIFSGGCTGKIGENTNISLKELNSFRSYVQFDISVLWDICIHLINEVLEGKTTDANLKFYSNTTIYESLGKYNFIEFKDSHRDFLNSVIEKDEFIAFIIDQARHGTTFDSLVQNLSDRADVSVEESREFVMELIENSILLSGLYPKITAKDPFEKILNEASQLNSKLYPQLLKLDQARKKISRNNLGENLKVYDEIETTLKKLSLGDKTFHKVDLKVECIKNTIGYKDIEVIKEAISLLHSTQFNHYDQIIKPDLNNFCEAFRSTYGEREVPLLAVLDPDYGIGYPINAKSNEKMPLLRGLTFGQVGKKLVQDHTINEWDFFLLNKVRECFQNDCSTLHLNDSEIQKFIIPREEPLPQSFYTICSLIKNEEEGPGVLVHHQVTAGASATRVMGRFTNMDEELYLQAKASLDQEHLSNPDVIYAEVNYCSNRRGINVCTRRRLRDYEILMYPINSGDDYTITLDDLFLSVLGTEIILRSKRLGKRVIPRLSSAHTVSRSMPHYRFLAELQYQGASNHIFWDWGTQSNCNYLPRVMYKNVILKPARWQIDIKDFKACYQGDVRRPDFEQVKTTLSYLKIPNNFLVTELDNNLPISIENKLSLKIFWDILYKKESLLIHEDIQLNNSLVKSRDKYHNNEIVIPWNSKELNKFKKQKRHFDKSCINIYNPGDEWVYFKLYMNRSNFDEILTCVVGPIVNRLKDGHKIDKWFFAKHSDNVGPHLRVRYHIKGLNDYTLVLDLMKEALAPYINNYVVWKYELGSYEPETDRYLLKNMANSEKLFYHDSECVLQYFIDHINDEDSRWKFAFLGFDQLLNDFHLDLDEKYAFTKANSNGFKGEFNFHEFDRKKELSKKFREFSKEVNRLEDNKHLRDILNIRSKRLQPIIQEILSDKHSWEVKSLLSSYTHMFLNRTFKHSSRQQEMVLYDFMSQYYKSKIGRRKKEAQRVLVEH